MLELNLSVKVLDRKAPYLFVWWNDADGCADGLMVTCECQGHLPQQNPDNAKSPDWYANLAKAMQSAEIVTVHPQRNGTSLCKLSDVVEVKKTTKAEKKTKRKKKKKRRKKSKKPETKKDEEEWKDASQEQDEDGMDEETERDEDVEGDETGQDEPEEETNETENDVQPEDRSIKVTDRDLNGSVTSETNVDGADVDINEGDDERVTIETSETTVEATTVPISIGSMSQAIHDMLSPSDQASKGLLPTVSILPPPATVPDALDGDNHPETGDRVSQLKALKDKKYLEGYNHKLKNRKTVIMLCEICGAATSNKSFKKHMDAVHLKGQNEGLHPCSICHKEFLYSANLRRHELIHYNTRFHCNFCGKSFAQAGACKTHERKYHGGETTVATVTKSTSVTKLTTWPHYKVANRAAVVVQCKICNKKMKRPSLRSHMETHNPEGVSCPICHKLYSSTNSLRIHAVVHSEKKFQCSVCGKRFHHSSGLVIHMRIHNNDKPLSCRYCGERFSRHQARINHERRHTGEKPYSCTICVKDWRDRTTYIQHMRRHHPNEPMMTLRKSVLVPARVLILASHE